MNEVGFTSQDSKWQVFKGKDRYLIAMKAKKQGRDFYRLGKCMFIEKMKINDVYITALPLAA